MHHFPGSKDPMAVSANKAGGNRRAGERAAGSLALDGKMSVPTVIIITNSLAKQTLFVNSI